MWLLNNETARGAEADFEGYCNRKYVLITAEFILGLLQNRASLR
jgi:hypothetical protein